MWGHGEEDDGDDNNNDDDDTMMTIIIIPKWSFNLLQQDLYFCLYFLYFSYNKIFIYTKYAI